MKVFISQPMNGKDEQTILKERAKMISRIKEQYPDAEILESYFEDYKPSTGNVALKCLSKSLELLADADEAWFAPGWQNARGCRIENDCAIAYGIPFMNEDTNVDMPKQMAADTIACIQQLENHIREPREKVAQLEAAQPRWISVEERLPYDCVDVIVFTRSGYTSGISIAHVLKGRWFSRGIPIKNVTHWMLLPKAPK